ncbi:RimK family alpha-L-glutamate ligase [Neobacillus niacini]|uniref:ATP-grasp domain-containing protein n=1 Tax=Neobacillus niacini TaxID=86668 RepID=UPI002FFFDF66
MSRNQISCWIVYNGSLTSPKFIDQAEMIKMSAEKRNISCTIYKNHELIMEIIDGNLTLNGQSQIKKPDFVIFLDKDLLLGKHLEKLGIPVYNPISAIERCDNKAVMYQTLANHGLPIPETIIAPKVYKGFELKDRSYYDYVMKRLGFPMIIKEVHGSFGMKVYLINNEREFFEKVDELSGISYLFQKFIDTSFGRDIRINVVNDKAVATMYRKSETDFRANVTNGGKMYTYEPTDAQIELAVKCSQIMGTYFSGIDILFGENEEPIICEVNSNAHLRNIYDCTGVWVADYMIDFVLDHLQVGEK